jgi:RNA polymerase primary sigma factor
MPPAAGADDADVEEQAEQALSTVDSEFGRTTDPVRMYMREMGSVELLTREGEIEIAKRIEDGLKHMIQAISACPTTIAEILSCADKIARDEMRIDELIDGLIDPETDGSLESWRPRWPRTKRRRGRRGGGQRGSGGGRRGWLLRC